MTDNEIIKALEKCSYHQTMRACFKCPLENNEDCKDNLQKYALDLINRQKAEIERLTICRKEEVEKLMSATDKVIAEAKTKAINEFADKLLDKAISTRNYFEIKSLVQTVKEEMAGDSDDV